MAERTGPDPISAPVSPCLDRSSWAIDEVDDPRLLALHAYWDRRRQGRPMPPRSAIDPADIPALLPAVFLVDVLESPRDYRFRLAGTDLREVIGVELTGRRVGDVLPPDFATDVRIRWDAVVEQRRPMVCKGHLWIEHREFIRWQDIILPLSTDGRTVDKLLGAITFSRK